MSVFDIISCTQALDLFLFGVCVLIDVFFFWERHISFLDADHDVPFERTQLISVCKSRLIIQFSPSAHLPPKVKHLVMRRK